MMNHFQLLNPSKEAVQARINCCDIERALEYERWMRILPYIKWPVGWEVKAVPPLGAKLVRYWVKNGDSVISIYLDCHNLSGYMPWPFWEIHPVEGDVARCKWDDIDGKTGLLNLIRVAKGELKLEDIYND